MACPECLSDEVIVHEYDFGICPQTGYHDAGERFQCLACGASGDAEDLGPCNSISAGSFRAKVSCRWDDGTLSPAPALFFLADKR